MGPQPGETVESWLERERLHVEAVSTLSDLAGAAGPVLRAVDQAEFCRVMREHAIPGGGGLSPIYDIDFSRLGPDRAIFIVGTVDGQPVTTQSVRLYDWQGTNLRDEAQSLRMFADDPGPGRAAGWSVVCGCPSAETITGRVVHSGSIWVHKDLRGDREGGYRLSQLLGRLNRLAGLGAFGADYYFTFVTADLERRAGIRAVYGYSRSEPGAVFHFATRQGVPVELVWMHRDELLTDMGLVADGLLARPARAVADVTAIAGAPA